jgi:hypothetical protein
MRSFTSGMLAVALAAAAAAAPSGAGQGGASPQARGYTLAEAPAALKPAAARAQQAFDEFQAKLIGRMNTALGNGGPLNALGVYRDEALSLTSSIGRERKMRIGRTSHKLRNPRNGPPVWAAPYVNAAAATDFGKASTWVVPIGENVGVIAPLETKEVCTLCHGPADKLPPELLGAIRKSFPGDQATGFAAGQVRGWIWAEVPKR